MLGVSGMMGSTGDGAATAGTQTHDSGGGETGVLGEEEKLVMRIDEAGGDRSSGGNRWPRQETVALLKIRSEMDAIFKDTSLKGPLWEEVSRKLAELGYHRNAKKCKEKFENVFKYHKRTKEGRASKPESKTYRFFDQLEALETHPPVSGQPPSTLNHPRPTMSLATKVNDINITIPTVIVPAQVSNSSSTIPSSLSPINVSPINAVTTMANNAAAAAANLVRQAVGIGNFGSVSTSSSTSSDEDIERRSRKKRKWEVFFQRLMKDVMDKQEAMQKKFLETLEKRERDRVAREESWRVMEMARMNREHDILVQERSTAAAKDAAVIAFLQKVSDQQLPVPIPSSAPIQMQIQIHPQTQPHPQQPQPQETSSKNNNTTVRSVPPVLPSLAQPPPPAPAMAAEILNSDNGNENFSPASSSRWPKAEVQALIGLRTNMDLKYQDNGPKGPLWEEISSSMKKLGYNRNAKRCKEKWENINKYFKKVKESNKRRPEDSKTCPYFHQLDAIYKEKSKLEIIPANFTNPSTNLPEDLMVPIMAQPEQQWPLQPVPQQQHHHHHRAMGDHDSDNLEHTGGEDDEDDNNDDDDDDDDDDVGGYEIVTNKPPSSAGTVE